MSKSPIMDRARSIVRPLVIADQPIRARELQAEHSISHVTFEAAVAVEKARLEGLTEARQFGTTKPTDVVGPFPNHPFADLFPMIEEAALNALAADIADVGLINAVVLHDGMVLDGRNRIKACEIAGVLPRYEVYEGDNPLGFVISLNVKRRHLATGQLAASGANMANIERADTLRQGSRSAILQNGAISQADAGTMVGVSTRNVAAASAIKKKNKIVFEALFAGHITVECATDIASLNLDRVDLKTLLVPPLPLKDILRWVAARLKDRKRKATFERIMEEASDVGMVVQGWPTGKFSVFYVDPPWRDEFGPNSRSIENHYPTMSTEEIKNLDVESICTDDGLLYLWALPHMQEQAHEVMRAWGFEYRTNMVWVKDKIGLGQWVRNQHEILLIGRRGAFPTPEESSRCSSVVHAPVGKHSEKPEIFAEMIEGWYPDAVKIELFRRGARRGWSAWGFEAKVAAE